MELCKCKPFILEVTKVLNKMIFNNYIKAYSELANLGFIQRIKYEEIAQYLGRLDYQREIEQVQKIQYPHFLWPTD